MCTPFPLPTPQVGGQRRFVDISVPRNIAHDINEVDGAIVYNVDDLKEVRARAAMAAAMAELQQVADG